MNYPYESCGDACSAGALSTASTYGRLVFHGSDQLTDELFLFQAYVVSADNKQIQTLPVFVARALDASSLAFLKSGFPISEIDACTIILERLGRVSGCDRALVIPSPSSCHYEITYESCASKFSLALFTAYVCAPDHETICVVPPFVSASPNNARTIAFGLSGFPLDEIAECVIIVKCLGGLAGGGE